MIRYVPYKNGGDGEEGSRWKKSMELALRSREIKESVPLPGGGCGDDEDGTLLGVDMRKMLQN